MAGSRLAPTERKLWTVALTRAGALAILSLANDPSDLVSAV